MVARKRPLRRLSITRSASPLSHWRSRRARSRAREIGEGLAALPPLSTSYTSIAMTQKLRRIIDEGVGYGLALEGISAADVARAHAK